jgi:dethiobiotin synthetase/adenosylmethionine--8-amino-7-oxononanoate aminotransferase
MQRVGAALWPSLQAFQVYGANTNVGKTIVSTILCKAFKEREKLNVYYLKPVSTGPIEDADGR